LQVESVDAVRMSDSKLFHAIGPALHSTVFTLNEHSNHSSILYNKNIYLSQETKADM